MSPLLIVIIIVISAFIFLRLKRKQLHVKRSQLVDSFVFPDKVYERVQAEYPHLSKREVQSVIEGLREYFQISLLAKRKALAMPSQAVDVAWHEFILFTREYHHFCNKALGRFLHHTPAEAMSSPTIAQEGIKRAWRLSCFRESINTQSPQRLPLLFSIDAKLKIENGFKYSLNCQGKKGDQYCASHIGCGSGCSGGSSDSHSSNDSGCSSGGCGGD
ncbi:MULTISPECIES: hypothetical protein [unclassified Neptuniibacter]|uniref:glycine-rich domain-containing protein n=1 Tax=unclassified Neptuniibacter TaxID=2630693 RepID=UPI000C43D0FB|nr:MULTISPECIES: hypothetical protein [unclassified Neptuniibacter]MAY41072.1 hypothetical protein [Oceanospirillaceae bacterium]|tara:strand:- start:26750 stop:27400 length:651 start_codon:yes stop_codon:yes gene_type:complete